MTRDDEWTVRRILEWTTEHLRAKGSASPRLDAEILLAHARGCPRIALYVRYDEILSDEHRAAMRELVRRRAAREPVAYLVGHREFFGLDFRVGPDVLVPRPDTETLVLELLDRAKPLAAPRILDLGTGSGCIAVAVAKHHPGARLVATDLSPAALDVAQDNARRLEVADRIDFRAGDLFAALQPGDAPFDVVASNPPYVAEAEWDALQPDVALHEPRAALAGGADGLDLVRRLLAEAPAHLVPDGTLLVEIAPEQAPAVETLLASAGTWSEHRIVKDLGGHPRTVVATRA